MPLCMLCSVLDGQPAVYDFLLKYDELTQLAMQSRRVQLDGEGFEGGVVGGRGWKG